MEPVSDWVWIFSGISHCPCILQSESKVFVVSRPVTCIHVNEKHINMTNLENKLLSNTTSVMHI